MANTRFRLGKVEFDLAMISNTGVRLSPPSKKEGLFSICRGEEIN